MKSNKTRCIKKALNVKYHIPAYGYAASKIKSHFPSGAAYMYMRQWIGSAGNKFQWKSEFYKLHSRKMHLKLSSTKMVAICPGGDELSTENYVTPYDDFIFLEIWTI